MQTNRNTIQQSRTKGIIQNLKQGMLAGSQLHMGPQYNEFFFLAASTVKKYRNISISVSQSEVQQRSGYEVPRLNYEPWQVKCQQLSENFRVLLRHCRHEGEPPLLSFALLLTCYEICTKNDKMRQVK